MLPTDARFSLAQSARAFLLVGVSGQGRRSRLEFFAEVAGVPRTMSPPSIVPAGVDHDIYLVLDQFGDHLGRAWVEATPIARRCFAI